MTLLTTEQAAEVLATSARHVRRLIADHGLPRHKIGKFVRISSADLEAFIAAGRHEPHNGGSESPGATQADDDRAGRRDDQ
jgi:excisionase family DNA binding protein